ncbi:MAG: TRAP transporter large permease [Rhodospirillales bacterium]|jgi:C4-dicarboxylate transporter DctM subunit|nr:TRAP transporter large permease [Rhodospirillales bacterium]
MTIAILLGCFFLLAMVGFPIAFALGAAAVVAIVWDGTVPLLLVPQRMFVFVDSFTIMAVPFFLFTGELMNSGGITKRIVDFAETLVGHFRGGLAHVNIVASMFFGGINGSSAADTSAIGGVMIPAMVKRGFDVHFSVAVTCASSCMGPIIPPSIVLIIYGAISGVSIGGLFLAGVIPGFIFGICQMGLCYAYARKGLYVAPPQPRANLATVGRTMRRGALPLLIPLIIVGGIVGGVVTATEAGVLAAALALGIAVIYREMNGKALRRTVSLSVYRTGQSLIIAAAAAPVAWLLTKEKFGVLMVDMLGGVAASPIMVLCVIAVIVLVTGCFVDAIGTLMILVPVFYPLAGQLGIDPYHLALVISMATVLGGLTPPVAPLLYLANSIADADIAKSTRASMPFFLISISAIVIVIVFPPLATALPRLLMG